MKRIKIMARYPKSFGAEDVIAFVIDELQRSLAESIAKLIGVNPAFWREDKITYTGYGSWDADMGENTIVAEVETYAGGDTMRTFKVTAVGILNLLPGFMEADMRIESVEEVL